MEQEELIGRAKNSSDYSEDNKIENLILGGGPAGLALAFELHRAGKAFMVIEKNEALGGLSKTLEYGEFRTDIGPHRFFSQNKYLYDLIQDLLGKKWIKVNRFTRFYIKEKFFLYPVDLKNIFQNVGIYRASRFFLDYLWQKIKKIFIKRQFFSFEEQIISDFGKSLAELNMLNYTEKLWGLPCSKISSDWASQRIKGLSLKEVIKNSVIKLKNGPKTLVNQFYYPDTGTGLIYEKIKERTIEGKNNFFKLNSHPLEISHNECKITEVSVKIDGRIQVLKIKHLISSIPITEFIGLLKPKVPDEILEAAKNLKFRSHISFFITLDKPSVFSDQWVYFPDKEIPFCRISEPKNFSKKMSPEGKTSLMVEFFCWENDNIWKASREELLELSIKWLEKIDFIKKEEIIDCYIHKEKYAYPIYDLNYKKHSDKIKSYLKKFDNFQSIGRAGCFKYNNQDHALEMGILAARNILEDEKIYNPEEVGSENDYFERGYSN